MSDTCIEYRLVGRETELKYLHDLWDEHKYRIIGLYGLKTVGKSRLILEFIYNLSRAHSGLKYYYFNFREIKTFKKCLRLFCEKFSVQPISRENTNGSSDEDAEEDEENDRTDKVIEKINNSYKDDDTSCVILLDNLEDAMHKAKKDGSAPGLLEESLWDILWRRIFRKMIGQCPKSYLFITSTTYAKLSQYGKVTKPIDLNPLEDSSSIKLLKEITGDEVDFDGDDLAWTIGRLCFGLPMAIINTGNSLREGIYRPEEMACLLAEETLEAMNDEFIVADERIDCNFKRNVSKLCTDAYTNLLKLAITADAHDRNGMQVEQVAKMLDCEKVAQFKMRFVSKYRYRGLINYDKDKQEINCHPILKTFLLVDDAIKDLRQDLKKKVEDLIQQKVKKLENISKAEDELKETRKSDCEDGPILAQPTEEIDKGYMDELQFFPKHVNVLEQCYPAQMQGTESDEGKYLKSVDCKEITLDNNVESDAYAMSQENNSLLSPRTEGKKSMDASDKTNLDNSLNFKSTNLPSKSLSDSKLNIFENNSNDFQNRFGSSTERRAPKQWFSLNCVSIEENDKYPSTTSSTSPIQSKMKRDSEKNMNETKKSENNSSGNPEINIKAEITPLIFSTHRVQKSESSKNSNKESKDFIHKQRTSEFNVQVAKILPVQKHLSDKEHNESYNIPLRTNKNNETDPDETKVKTAKIQNHQLSDPDNTVPTTSSQDDVRVLPKFDQLMSIGSLESSPQCVCDNKLHTPPHDLNATDSFGLIGVGLDPNSLLSDESIQKDKSKSLFNLL